MAVTVKSKSGAIIDRAYLKKFTDLYLDCLEKQDPKDNKDLQEKLETQEQLDRKDHKENKVFLEQTELTL